MSGGSSATPRASRGGFQSPIPTICRRLRFQRQVSTHGSPREAGTMGVFSRAEARTGVSGGGLEGRVVTIALMSTIAALMAAFSVYQYRNWAADRADLAKDSVLLAQAIGAAAHKGLSPGD